MKSPWPPPSGQEALRRGRLRGAAGPGALGVGAGEGHGELPDVGRAPGGAAWDFFLGNVEKNPGKNGDFHDLSLFNERYERNLARDN